MKLHIEVSLSPSEIPLATELFHVLRQITDSVTTRNNSVLFADLLARLGRPPMQPNQTQEEQLEQVAAEITALLDANGSSAEVVQQLFDAFMAHVFGSGQTPVGAPPGALLYVFLLSRLPEQYRTKMRDKLVPTILKFLTVKRSIDCDRREFFAYAEAFASLVKLEFVSITGAVTTITTLLQQADTRCAAITMLGKTVELCLSLLAEKCDPTQLATMRTALRGVNDDAFRYDISYIQENMGWSDGSAGASPTLGSVLDAAGASALGAAPGIVAGAAPGFGSAKPVTNLSAKTHSLVATRSYAGHTNTIFALGYDPQFDLLISSGKDSQVIAWSPAGVPYQAQAMVGHYACSIDINSARRQLFVCGVVQDGPAAGTAPAVIAYEIGGSASSPTLSLLGKLEKRGVKLVSCVKALEDGANSHFITGESSSSGEAVCYYDTNGGAFGSLQPIQRYSEHKDIITSLTQCPDAEGVFLSGSRDCAIRMWDRRKKGCVAQLLSSGGAPAHSKMITCLDSAPGVVVSAGLDKLVKLWDVRRTDAPVRQLAVDDNAILKVALSSNGSAVAVSTLRRLYLADLSGDGVAAVEGSFMEQRNGRYHDLKWNAANNLLYAAGDDRFVDVYSVVSKQ